MPTMEDRMLRVEIDQANHERVCASRWGILIKLIGWGGASAFLVLVGVAGWGLNRVYDAQQYQAAALEQILATKH